jgi:hypothetical protein
MNNDETPLHGRTLELGDMEVHLRGEITAYNSAERTVF